MNVDVIRISRLVIDAIQRGSEIDLRGTLRLAKRNRNNWQVIAQVYRPERCVRTLLRSAHDGVVIAWRQLNHWQSPAATKQIQFDKMNLAFEECAALAVICFAVRPRPLV